MKEFRILKGHKKEVCSIAWHPVHPILVSGGSEGAILHWDLSAPDPDSFDQPILPPRATLSQAHDSNVWSLAYHPFGHILVSASNDYTTRFWSRERPGDVTSVFAGGGEKPPEVTDTGGQDEEDDMMVPGLGFGQAGAGAVPGFGWNRDDEKDGPKPFASGNLFEPQDGDFIPGIGPSGAGPSTIGSAQGSNPPGPVFAERDEFGRERDVRSGGDDEWRRRGNSGFEGDRGYGGDRDRGYSGDRGFNGGGGGHNRGSRFGPQKRGGRY